MEEIVIKDEKMLNNKGYKPLLLQRDEEGFVLHIGSGAYCITETEACQLADAIYKLLGISMTDLQRQAFEAGENAWGADGRCNYTFDDYQNREK